MYTEIYPIFTAPRVVNIRSEIRERADRPSRIIEKEMYERLLKSFDNEESGEHVEFTDRILRFA